MASEADDTARRKERRGEEGGFSIAGASWTELQLAWTGMFWVFTSSVALGCV
jgi:hypothetical protein